MKTSTLIKKICFWVGVALLAIAILLVIARASFIGKAINTTGTVVSLEENYGSDTISYIPVIEYDAGGTRATYRSTIAVSENKYTVGQTVGLLYSIHDGGEYIVRMNTFSSLWTAPLVVGIVSLLFFLLAFVFALQRWLHNRMKKVLRATGTKIDLPIAEVRLEKIQGGNQTATVSMNMYVIYVYHTDVEGKEHTFKTRGLRRHPNEFGKDVGSMITVFYDPARPRKYFIDVDFIPEQHQY